MDVSANLDTAQVYLNAGMNDRARECLDEVLAGIPEEARTGTNEDYLRWLALRARLDLSDLDREACARRVEAGLAMRPRHVDLLFLRTLLYWDCGRHDEMFMSLLAYLGAVAAGGEAAAACYEYAAPAAVAEALRTLLPAAYRQAPSRTAFRAAIERMAANSGHELFTVVLRMLEQVDLQEAAGRDGDPDSGERPDA